MDGKRTYIIAQAGVNHNGCLATALKLVDVAAAAGADAIMFQVFSTRNLVRLHDQSAEYQLQTSNPEHSQYANLEKLELNANAFECISQHCQHKAIDFIATPSDRHSLNLLIHQLGIREIKIGASDISNTLLLSMLQNQAVDILLSTATASLAQIDQALTILRSGIGKHIRLVHGPSGYPAPMNTVNLRAINTLKQAFQLPVGFADQGQGIHLPVAAVACGASVIEKSITLSRELPGPDHQTSLMADEFSEMVSAIRDIEQAMGHGRPRRMSLACHSMDPYESGAPKGII